jgi:hypothetical protein
MADENDNTGESLHQDTIDFLAKRNEERSALAGIFTEPEEDEEDPAPVVEGPVVGGCNPEVGGCAELNNRFAAYPLDEGVENSTAENGWPASDGLYADVMTDLKDPKKFMSDIIPHERQINTLESYRRMLLHKKERKCHLIAAYSAYWAKEALSQQELEQLLLNKIVGQEGNAS